jgi:hypothetical protein
VSRPCCAKPKHSTGHPGVMQTRLFLLACALSLLAGCTAPAEEPPEEPAFAAQNASPPMVVFEEGWNASVPPAATATEQDTSADEPSSDGAAGEDGSDGDGCGNSTTVNVGEGNC